MEKSKKDKQTNDAANNLRCKTTIDSSVKATALKPVAPKKEAPAVIVAEPKPSPSARLSLVPMPIAKGHESAPRDDGRDRRHNPDGRRGRFAEKAPAGTRTKMLKIIYERKADIQEKRRYLLLVKITLAVVLAGSVYIAGRATIQSAYQGAHSLYQALHLENWYERFSTPVKLPSDTKATTTVKPVPAVTALAKPPVKAQARPQSAQPAKKTSKAHGPKTKRANSHKHK